MPTFDELVREIVKQYKQDSVVFADVNFFLDNTVDNILNRYEIYTEFELARELVKESAKVIGNKAKLYKEE